MGMTVTYILRPTKTHYFLIWSRDYRPNFQNTFPGVVYQAGKAMGSFDSNLNACSIPIHALLGCVFGWCLSGFG